MKKINSEKINIVFDGTESSKSEIVYNNIIDNMNLSEEEQIAYLKSKVTNLEIETRNKVMTLILFIIGLLGISFGLFLMVINIHWLGIIIVLGTFFAVLAKIIYMYRGVSRLSRNIDYDRIENLRKALNSKLK